MSVPSQCGDCPMTSVAKGFALHSGAMPPKSGICVLLESPGPDEPSYLVKDLIDGAAEMSRRREQYPQLEDRWIRMGAPVVGRAGTLMWSWILAPLGLQRSDVAVFNTLHCYPGKTSVGVFAYPTGAMRKRAEATCAQTWMTSLLTWDPTVSVVAMHPSAISRDVTPLPVVLRAVEKAKMFAAKGERVLLLMGGKAAKHWMGYGENTTRWCGHWQAESEYTRRKRLERWNENRRLSVTKTVKVRKLTAKGALARLLSRLTECKSYGTGESLGWGSMDTQLVGPIEYAEMLALTVTKKKVKVEVASATT